MRIQVRDKAIKRLLGCELFPPADELCVVREPRKAFLQGQPQSITRREQLEDAALDLETHGREPLLEQRIQTLGCRLAVEEDVQVPAGRGAGLIEAGACDADGPEGLLDESESLDGMVWAAGVDVEHRQPADLRPSAATEILGIARDRFQDLLICKRVKSANRHPGLSGRVLDDALGAIVIEREKLLACTFWT